MILIEKNIVVVDEQGNFYESTYPRRAKGLVKNGRARFINENTICLVSLPNQNVEDNFMSDNVNVNNEVNNEICEPSVSIKPTMNYILEQITKITSQTEYLNQTVQTIGNVSDSEYAFEQSESLVNIVRERELTNRQALGMLEKIYDDLKPVNDNEAEMVTKKFKFDVINSLIVHNEDGDNNDLIRDLIQQL